jgi:hypothetical protein
VRSPCGEARQEEPDIRSRALAAIASSHGIDGWRLKRPGVRSAPWGAGRAQICLAGTAARPPPLNEVTQELGP